MANTIRLRRGTTAPSAGSFVEGEPAWDSVNGKLYIKNAAGAMVQINSTGGSSAFSAGTVTSPGISVGNGATYLPGLYSPSNDTLAVTTNGTQCVKFDSTGLTLPGATSGNITLTATAVSGSNTLTLPATTGTIVTTGDTGSVTSTMIADGTIVNADINASAAIAYSKLATLTAGSIVLGNASNVATATAVTGDVTISSAGVTAIGSGVIVNADVNASAAIDGTKINPSFGNQNIISTSQLTIGNSQTTGTTGVFRVLPSGGNVLLQAGQNTSSGSTAPLCFTSLGNTAEYMRLDSGKLLIGITTGNSSGGVLQISDGITFPATAVDAANSNTLDDYEEGNFSPTVAGTTAAGSGTYSVNIGRYTKIGNRVFYMINLTWTAHTGTGNLYVTNLPFIVANVTNGIHTAAVRCSNLALTANNVLAAYTSPVSVNITLEQQPVGGGAATSVAMDTAATLSLSGHYFV